MQMLSEDDTNIEGLTDEDLDAAWDLWFDLAQETNDSDPPYTHGVFQLCRDAKALRAAKKRSSPSPSVRARL